MNFFRSLRHKLISSFLIVSLIPFLLILIFSINEGKKSIILNIKEDLKSKNRQTTKLIEKDFKYIRTQMGFWSQNQIMDDILVKDIDKRILNFLRSAQASTSLNGNLFVINKKGKIISSTDIDLIGKTFPIEQLNTDKIKVINFKKNYFLIFSPVYASFTKNKIGYLIYLIDIHSLEKLIQDTKGYFTIIYNKNYLSNKRFVKPENESGFIETENVFMFYSTLSKNLFLDDWYIISGTYKSIVLNPINKIQFSFIFIGIVGILGIVLLSFFISKNIINPIEKLSSLAREIAEKQDYSKRIEIHSSDELGDLSTSFNHLISEIENAFQKLENESKERLMLFTKLVEFFNKITKTSNKREIINLVESEINDFFECKSVRFSNTKEKLNSYCFPVETNLENTKKLEGLLCFEIERNITEEEYKFLQSIAKMVSLWIERLKIMEMLKELLKKAESSSNAKSAFIANMSHELRTPLNSIIGFSQLMETSDDLPEEYREIARNIKISGQHLLSLINDILDFAKVESEKIKIKPEKFKLNEIIDELKAIIKPIADSKSLELIFPENTDLKIYTDKKVLKQILLNLLSNAVKFTEEGFVRLEIKRENDKTLFIVEDTGIGIDKKNLDKIFEDFEQIENPLQKKYKGTGLGLALVKRLVKLLKGKINAESGGVGKGSKFTVSIPNYLD